MSDKQIEEEEEEEDNEEEDESGEGHRDATKQGDQESADVVEGDGNFSRVRSKASM